VEEAEEKGEEKKRKKKKKKKKKKTSGEGRERKGGQRKEGDAGCVRVVPCGIGRSQVRHAFLLRS